MYSFICWLILNCLCALFIYACGAFICLDALWFAHQHQSIRVLIVGFFIVANVIMLSLVG